MSFPREYGDYNGASVTIDATAVVAETGETNNTASGFGRPVLSAIGEQNSSRCTYP